MATKPQARAPMTVPISAEFLLPQKGTTLFWLGSGGILINCRGTLLTIDPVLETDPDDPLMSEAGNRLLVPVPISAANLRSAQAVLYTHADYDHLGEQSAAALARGACTFYGTPFVANVLENLGISAERIRRKTCGDIFRVGPMEILLTPAHHSWQLSQPERFDWAYKPEDCCGYRITTPDGVIWAPGDSILLPEHLKMEGVDVLFADFSNDPYHFGTQNAIHLANTLSNAALIMYHYGTYDAPDKPAFNCDPQDVIPQIGHLERLLLPAPGQPLYLSGGVVHV